jgi:O-antigen/teichoic acid export membrane protein
LFIGLHEALFYYGLREKKYKFLALTINLQALGMISTRLLLGYLGYTGLGLMFSYLLGYFLSFVLLASKFKIPLRQQLQNLNLKILIKKYINFPRFSLVADSLSVLTNMAPNLLLNKMFGSTTTGYFSMSEKILGAPLWFVTSSVGDVFKQEASEQYRLTGSCRKIFEKTSKSLFFLGIIPFILIFLIVPSLIPFILGEVWAPVGDYIRIFSLMYFSSFVVNPISYIVYIVNKQNYGILFQTIKAISIVLAFVLGLYYNNLQLTLILWSALIILSNVLVFVLSYKLARNCKYVGPTQENN